MFKALHLGLALLLAFASSSLGQEGQPSEYQVKAAFLYKFTRFIEWPEAAFSRTNSPFVVGIIGENPFGQELERAVKNKEVNGHGFIVKEIKTLAEAKACHVLFISQSERRRLPEIIGAVATLPVLTVSETDRFLALGGIINFLVEENKVRFEISDVAARRAGLKISSKLLYLARRPERGGGK